MDAYNIITLATGASVLGKMTPGGISFGAGLATAIITDPIQSRLGIHEKRLNRLVDSLEDALRDNKDSKLKLRSQYLARIFDLLDFFRTAASTIL